MNIYLIGLTGVGKSAVGERLSELLNYNFIDLDHLIVHEGGKSIEQFFEQDGEPAFRRLEAMLLRQIPAHSPTVVATGGGAPCFENSMEYIKSAGLSVFLHTPLQIIVDRLHASDISARPMIKGKTQQQLYDFMRQKLTERLPFYSSADIAIDVSRFENAQAVAIFLRTICEEWIRTGIKPWIRESFSQ